MDQWHQRPKPESLLTGLNHSMRWMGRELHVQTEDLGSTERCIRTQVFCEGRVLLTARAGYPDPADGDFRPGLVSEIMRQQHYSVIREIEDRLGGHS